MKKSNTLGALKKTDYTPLSIQQELAQTLRARMQGGQQTIEGLLGYENPGIPAVEGALISGQRINLPVVSAKATTRLESERT